MSELLRASFAGDQTVAIAVTVIKAQRQSLKRFLRKISKNSPSVMSTLPQHLYEFGPYRLDTTEKLLLRDGEPVALTPKAFDTLVALVERSGHLVEKDELMKVVWADAFVEESNLTNNVYALRKMLGQAENGRSYIETVPKRGYRFTAPVKKLSPEVLAVEKRTITRIVTEETVADDDPPQTLVINSGEALAIEGVRLPTEQRPAWRWLLIALLSFSVVTGGIFVYRSFSADRALTAARRPQIESIAVLPFKNETGNSEVEYLSDGVTESVINSLSQLPQLKVIARSSSFHYKGKDVNAQEVSRVLGVQAIVLGHVFRRDENLVVSVELIDASDKSQLWGERYVRKANDVQAVEEEIARTIAEKLRLRLSGGQEQQLSKRATQNPIAYEAYLNGMFYVRKGGLENAGKSLDYFNQAIALDPNFALAWVGVSRAHDLVAGNSLLEPQAARAKAKAAAHKALALDETLADAHVAVGQSNLNDWDWTGAEQKYRRAIELNPNLVEARFRYSDYLSRMGRHTEALAEIKRVYELDPLQDNLRMREGWTLFLARRYDEALERYQNAVKVNPNSPGAHNGLAFTYLGRGMYAQAAEEFQKSFSIQGGGFAVGMRCYLGYALAKAGKRNEAKAILAGLRATKEYVSPTELAELYVGLGDYEKAIASLERAYAARDLQLQNLNVSPCFDDLRSDPRFQDLVKRIGLPQSPN